MKLYELICSNNITHIYISPAVSNRRHYILDDIKLINYESTTDNALFFGMYDSVDYYKFKNHQGKKWIFWCGTDTDITNKSRLKHITNLISINKINGHMCKEIIVYNTLVKLDLNPTFIFFSLADPTKCNVYMGAFLSDLKSSYEGCRKL